MINSKAIGAGFALVLTSISAAQEAPTHHSFGTVNSGAGTRRSGPDGAGSSGDAGQDTPATVGSSSFESHPGDGRYDDADTGFGPYGDAGGIFAGAEGGHAGGSHGSGIFGGGPLFAGGAGGSSGSSSGGGSGSQGGGTTSGPDSGTAPFVAGPTIFADSFSPPDSGDGGTPQFLFYVPPPFDIPPPGQEPPPPPPKDAPPPSGPGLTLTPVPEPLTLSLFGSGLAGAITLRCRRTKKA